MEPPVFDDSGVWFQVPLETPAIPWLEDIDFDFPNDIPEDKDRPQPQPMEPVHADSQHTQQPKKIKIPRTRKLKQKSLKNNNCDGNMEKKREKARVQAKKFRAAKKAELIACIKLTETLEKENTKLRKIKTKLQAELKKLLVLCKDKQSKAV